jgi:hypothetical protein
MRFCDFHINTMTEARHAAQNCPVGAPTIGTYRIERSFPDVQYIDVYLIDVAQAITRALQPVHQLSIIKPPVKLRFGKASRAS